MIRTAEPALVPLDTSPEAAAVQREAIRRMTPEERVRTAVRMSEEARRLTLDGLRHRYPDASEAELRRVMLRRVYGDTWDRLVGE